MNYPSVFRASASFFLLGTLSLLALCIEPDAAIAHGGNYRGPSGAVRPGPGPLGGISPGGLGGVTARAAASAGTTPRPGRSTRSTATPLWELWWAYNREPFLELKSRIHRTANTESGDFSIGKSDRPFEVTRPDNFVVKEKIIPTLKRAMSDPNYDVRAAAVIALGKVGGSDNATYIRRAFGDRDRRVQESTALALGLLGNPDSIDDLTAVLRQTARAGQLLNRSRIQPRTRAFAAIGLGLIGRKNVDVRESIVPTLTQAALARDEARNDVPIAALTALSILQHPSATPALQRLLKDSSRDDTVRAHAVISMGKIGDPTNVFFVQQALRDKSIHVVRSAAIALGLLAEPADPRSVLLLNELIEKGNDPVTKSWALISLGRIGGNTARKALHRAFEEEQKPVRAFAALGLAINSRATGNLADGPALHGAFRTMKGDSVPGAVAIALGIMRYEPAKEDLLRAVVFKGDPDLRGYCAVALGLMNARDTVTPLLKLLRSKVDPNFQRSMATALGLMGDRRVVDRLTEILLEASTEYTTGSAATALGFVGDVSAVDPLIKTIWDEKRNADLARAQATAALGIVGDDSRLPPLHVVATDTNYRALSASLSELLTIQ